MIRLGMAAIVAAAALGGCTPQIKQDIDAASSGQPAPPRQGHCDATAVQDLIGQQRSDPLGTQIRERSGSRILRWITPGMAVTLDYREDRINVKLDDQGRVTELSCG